MSDTPPPGPLTPGPEQPSLEPDQPQLLLAALITPLPLYKHAIIFYFPFYMTFPSLLRITSTLAVSATATSLSMDISNVGQVELSN